MLDALTLIYWSWVPYDVALYLVFRLVTGGWK